MRRREPLAEPPARAWFERACFCVGLAFVMLFCVMTARESISTPAAGVASNEAECPAYERDGFVRATDAPQLRGSDHKPSSVEEELRASKAEIEDEDGTSDREVVASSPGSRWEAPPFYVAAFECSISVGSSHLLISTGLGRGPPVG